MGSRVRRSWVDPALSAKNIKWGKDYWDALAPYVSNRFYINEMMDETQEEVAVSYGHNYPRLVQIKNKYDPKNFFSQMAILSRRFKVFG